MKLVKGNIKESDCKKKVIHKGKERKKRKKCEMYKGRKIMRKEPMI